MLQPLVVGLLVGWTYRGIDWPGVAKPDTAGLPADVIDAAQVATADLARAQAYDPAHAVVFLLAATAFWLGCSNVARELVSERAVFRRERMSGLSVAAYVTSVFGVHVAVGALQIAVLFALGWAPVLQGSFVAAAALGLVIHATGVAVGMLVSAVSRTEVTAISTLPLLLLPQLLLAGYLRTYRDLDVGLRALSALAPIRWGFESLLDLEYRAADPVFSDLHDVFGIASTEGGWAPLVLITVSGAALGLATARLLTTSRSAEG